ncbi:MAG: ATP-dependent DNA helicase RecG, partial [Armatimonadetes bacterium]|nr:ATP-dependent DNA helicase RecG [Armatimonadota bacterium]
MPASTRSLDNPVQSVRGVGPRGGELLGRLGIATVWDLLRHVPRRYEDRTRIAAISDLRMGEMAVARGVVRAAETVNTRRSGMQITRVVIGDESGTAELVFFRQPFLLRRFQEMLIRRRAIVVYGQVRESGSGRPAFEHPEWEEVLPDEDLLSSGRIVPVYPLGEGLTQKWLRRMMASALDTHLDLIDDALPAGLMEMHRLTPITTAFRDVHLPESMDAALAARRRLVFDEFFVLQTGLALRRLGRAEETEVAVIPSTRADVERIISDVLPFEPTTDQTSAIREIAADMASGRQMNRLLHGDVGSGKTAVAVVALALVARAGLQAAVMAPTEILAQQQASVLRRWLEPAGIRIGLSTGSTGTRSRARLREELAEGTTSVVVGTHALIEDDVRFKSLGLVVIDEQHRFGVLQRQALQAKGTAPHVLVMSATPIPRTLTLTLYGDLDVTALRQSPPGRGSLKTHWKRPEAAAGVYAALATLLAQGKQAYVVCPLVEESDKLEAAAAKQHAERIQRDMLPGCRVGLLHGQMPGEAKEACLEAFRLGELDVLVSTTVIEVGIDV